MLCALPPSACRSTSVPSTTGAAVSDAGTSQDPPQSPTQSADAATSGGGANLRLVSVSRSTSENQIDVEVSGDEPIFRDTCDFLDVIAEDPQQQGWRDDYFHGGLLYESYVDGAFVTQTDTGCDSGRCIDLARFFFPTTVYERIGEAPRPDGNRRGAPLSDVARVVDGGVEPNASASTGDLVPVYETRRRTGKVTIRVRYFTSAACNGEPRVFQAEIDLDDVQ